MDAKNIIDELGGTSLLAAALNLTPSTVSSWKTSNVIPKWRRAAIVDAAERSGKALPPAALAYLTSDARRPPCDAAAA